MRSILLIAIVVSGIFSVNACKEKESAVIESMDMPVADEHTSQNSLDWNGTYSGTLKGLDGETFSVDLSLELDGMYAIELEEENKSDIVKRNKFNWSKDGRTIELFDVNEIYNKFFVGEDILVQLNKNGELPATEERDLYQLNKKYHEAEN